MKLCCDCKYYLTSGYVERTHAGLRIMADICIKNAETDVVSGVPLGRTCLYMRTKEVGPCGATGKFWESKK